MFFLDCSRQARREGSASSRAVGVLGGGRVALQLLDAPGEIGNLFVANVQRRVDLFRPLVHARCPPAAGLDEGGLTIKFSGDLPDPAIVLQASGSGGADTYLEAAGAIILGPSSLLSITAILVSEVAVRPPMDLRSFPNSSNCDSMRPSRCVC